MGPINERKDEETDRNVYSLSNLQTSHQLPSFPNLNKGFLGPTLTDVSGNNVVSVISKFGLTETPEEQSLPFHAQVADK